MQIKQYEKDGSAEIIFTEQEKKIINERGLLKLTPEGLRHFGNNLVKIVADFQINFKQEVRNLETKEQDVETS
tara:strand:- start:363 stop:581 length:219 start_codon:yes stop_codon:yes gene_type:complete